MGRIGPVIAGIVPGTAADSEQVVAVRRRHRVAGQIGLEAQVGKCHRGTAVIAEPRAQPRRELRRRLLEPVKVILPHDARGIEVEGDVVAEHPRVGEIQQVAGAAAEQRASGEEDITPEEVHRLHCGSKGPAILIGDVVGDIGYYRRQVRADGTSPARPRRPPQRVAHGRN